MTMLFIFLKIIVKKLYVTKILILFIILVFLNKLVLANSILTKKLNNSTQFESSFVFGTVFEDLNNNGMQDIDEEGIVGIRLITSTGFELITDELGRYSLPQNMHSPSDKGGQLVIFLDPQSLEQGQNLTTTNPLVKRVTGFAPEQFNFGLRKTVVNVELQNSKPIESSTSIQTVPTTLAESATIKQQPKLQTNTSQLESSQASQDFSPVSRNRAQAPKASNTIFHLKADGLFIFGRSDVSGIIHPGTDLLKSFVRQIQAEFQSIESISLKAHTDRVGTDEKNLALSYQRAETIKNLLLEYGLKTASFQLSGVGSSEPIVVCPDGNSQKTIQCLAPNRRFEINVKGLPSVNEGQAK